MRVELKPRQGIRSAAAAIALLAMLFLFGFVASIADSDWLFTTIYLLVILLLVALLRILHDPRNYECMRVVRGEMSFRELKQAIARESFDEPIRFLEYDFLSPCSFLVSERWVLLGEDRNNLACIPKNRVRAIGLSALDSNELEALYNVPDGASPVPKGETFHYFELICDDANSFVSGLIAQQDLDGALAILKQHFPTAVITDAPGQSLYERRLRQREV